MTKKESKYVKFGRNSLTQNDVYNYVAYDEANNCVLQVRKHTTFESDLPTEIGITAEGNYTYSTCIHEVLTAEEFWNVYKHAVQALYAYQLQKL